MTMIDRPFKKIRPFGPFLMKEQTTLREELQKAIDDEANAETEYQKLINLLEQNNMPDKAEIVRGIQEDEVSHRETFKDILNSID